VAKSVNSSLIQLVKPEDGISVDSVQNLMTPATGNILPVLEHTCIMLLILSDYSCLLLFAECNTCFQCFRYCY